LRRCASYCRCCAKYSGTDDFNLYLALENDLEIIPILNKIDLPSANPEEVTDEIMNLIGCKYEDVLRVSGKTGEGVHELLEQIVERIPAPVGDEDAPLQALIFDSVYNPFEELKLILK
jgi:GTP-binding protein LepA